MAKVIVMATWLANSYVDDGRRRQITDKNIKRIKVKLALISGRPGGTIA